MKKFIEILDDIKQTSEAIKAAKARENELVESYMKVCDLRERHEARKAVENEMLENSERKKDLTLTRKILTNNAKIALFNEVLPVALEILKKYSGKPYGEKTREKIAEEIKAATNCRFYIGSRYDSHYFDVYPVDVFGNDYNISCGTKYTSGDRKPLLINNKIQLVTFDEIELYYISCVYVENIAHRIKELKAVYKEAVAKQKELEHICSRFNALVVGDIPYIYSNKTLYAEMQV
nr:MAG TPA: hypothetical protein [Caudoviricetes sp.]